MLLMQSATESNVQMLSKLFRPVALVAVPRKNISVPSALWNRLATSVRSMLPSLLLMPA